jgi:hypothetical protein
MCYHVLLLAQPFLYNFLTFLFLKLFVQEGVFFLEGMSTFLDGSL